MGWMSQTMTERERNMMLNALWLGVPASLLHLIGQFVAMPRPLDFMPGCITAGLLIGAGLRTRHDEFIMQQFHRSAEFALAAAGLLMLVSLPLFGSPWVIGAEVGLAFIGVVYNLAFAVQRLGSR